MFRLALLPVLLLTSLFSFGSSGAATAASSDNIVPPGYPKVVTIPAIGVKAPVESLALTRPADAEAPYKWGDVAWYDRSARPGEEGRAQIYGHLDSFCCPAVFYRLKDLKKGDSIQVQYRNGKSLVFVVQWQATYLNSQMPSSFMYSPTTARGLLLITCAGVFHRDGTGYDHKLIVYASLVMPPSPPHRSS